MILTTEEIIDLLRKRSDVHVVDTGDMVEHVTVFLGEAKKYSIIINNQDAEMVKRVKSYNDEVMSVWRP